MNYSEELNKTPGERLKRAIKASKYGQQKKFAEAAFFTQQYISDMCRGIKQISHENAYKFGRLLNVRPEYILCYDDYMTDSEYEKSKTDKLFSSLGAFASNSDSNQKIDRLIRISELSEIIDKLKKLYADPNNCSNSDFESEFKLLSYLDEQLQNAFAVYYKYFAELPHKDKIGDDNQSHQMNDLFDGGEIVLGAIITNLRSLYPKGITEGEFLEKMKSEEERKRVHEAIEKTKCTFGDLYNGDSSTPKE